MTKSYDDIINLPRHISPTRPKMPIIKRAAQFAPFAALTGHEDAIRETARLTHQKIELDEYIKESLSDTLYLIANQTKDPPNISITYFQPDKKKKGGSYLTISGRVKKIIEAEHVVLIANKKIPLDEIINIEINKAPNQNLS